MKSGGYPKQRLTRAEAKLQTRQRLLDAAKSVFASRGFPRASVDEIAETAGYTVGALYSNFGSKEELFIELMSRHGQRRVTDALAAVTEAVASGDDVGAALGRLIIDVAEKDIDYAPLQVEFWLYAFRNPELAAGLARRHERTKALLRPLIGKGLDNHNASPAVDMDAATTVAIALFQGLVQQRRINPFGVSEQLYGQALRWLFAGIAATPTESESPSLPEEPHE